MTSTLSTAGTHSGSPPVTATAPYDTPNTYTARQASAISRPVLRSIVLHSELTSFIMNVRHIEHKIFLMNGLCVTVPRSRSRMSQAPQQVIAASLRRERHRSGLSLSEVARRAGVAKSTLSQLEAGTGNPSLETLWALCVALDIPFSRLLDPPRPVVQVIRAGEGLTVAAAEANYQATLLAVCPPNARRDVYRIVAEPGPGRLSEPHQPGVVEHIVISA